MNLKAQNISVQSLETFAYYSPSDRKATFLLQKAGHVIKAPMHESVSLVINTYQQAHFLAASIESALQQTVDFAEIIVVDDGSLDDPESVVARYSGVQLIRQHNSGLAAARNTGLNAASSEYIIFLDADDLLTTSAVSSGLSCHANNPGAGLVYGAHRRIGLLGEPLGDVRYWEIGSSAFRTLLRGNVIGMHATVIYNRRKLVDIGGFDASLPRCEDYDVYFRMALHYALASHHEIVALYRWHGSNMSADHLMMLKWVFHINDRQKRYTVSNPELEADRLMGRQIWRRYYAQELATELHRDWHVSHSLLPVVRFATRAFFFEPKLAIEVGRLIKNSAFAAVKRNVRSGPPGN